MRAPSIGQIAAGVWGLVAVASRTVTVTTNSDKTGYSLTAGSYSVRASSVQHGTITITTTASSNTAAISSVTLARAELRSLSQSYVDNTGAMTSDQWSRMAITDVTVVTMTRGSAVSINNLIHSYEVSELL